MSKQTVEEEVQDRWPISDKLTPSDRSIFEMWQRMFKDGAIWQKEQGIDWISVDGNPLPEVGKEVLVLLEGETLLKGKQMYDTAHETIWVVYFKDGEFPCTNRTVPHYAYITLPKTE